MAKYPTLGMALPQEQEKGSGSGRAKGLEQEACRNAVVKCLSTGTMPQPAPRYLGQQRASQAQAEALNCLNLPYHLVVVRFVRQVVCHSHCMGEPVRQVEQWMMRVGSSQRKTWHETSRVKSRLEV